MKKTFPLLLSALVCTVLLSSCSVTTGEDIPERSCPACGVPRTPYSPEYNPKDNDESKSKETTQSEERITTDENQDNAGDSTE